MCRVQFLFIFLILPYASQATLSGTDDETNLNLDNSDSVFVVMPQNSIQGQPDLGSADVIDFPSAQLSGDVVQDILDAALDPHDTALTPPDTALAAQDTALAPPDTAPAPAPDAEDDAAQDDIADGDEETNDTPNDPTMNTLDSIEDLLKLDGSFNSVDYLPSYDEEEISPAQSDEDKKIKEWKISDVIQSSSASTETPTSTSKTAEIVTVASPTTVPSTAAEETSSSSEISTPTEKSSSSLEVSTTSFSTEMSTTYSFAEISTTTEISSSSSEASTTLEQQVTEETETEDLINKGALVDNKTQIGLILGALFGGMLLVVSAVYLIRKRRSRKHDINNTMDENSPKIIQIT